MTKQPEPVPCRLFFILARHANTAVIFRRGPSRWVQVIRWDTARDTFEAGQWFHGRIYEKRCDLSPDGTLLIYFAQKINRRTLEDPDYTCAWTAISHPPYLTALALWPKGDCWHGGGLFETDRRVWLNHRPSAAKPHPNHRPHGLKVIDNPNAAGEDDPIFLRRLNRDGWVSKQEWKVRQVGSHFVMDRPWLLAKTCPNRPLTLEMAYSVEVTRKFDLIVKLEFTVRHEHGETSLDGAEWADWGRRSRLVFVRAGKVMVGNVDDNGSVQERELADFNAARPEQKRAPAWARRW